MKIAVIDYKAGNIQSVCNALQKLRQNFQVVSRPGELMKFDKVIFPGQGAAGSAMQVLLETGLLEILPNLKIPFLGICLGMQLLADFSEEDNVQCLGVIPGRVQRFWPAPSAVWALKIPQIGWNRVSFSKESPLLKGILSGYFYFANAYFLQTADAYVLGKANYGLQFPAIVSKENFYATQFHPEKSGDTGLQLLLNFCERC